MGGEQQSWNPQYFVIKEDEKCGDENDDKNDEGNDDKNEDENDDKK
jgi:hypothetical protein